MQFGTETRQRHTQNSLTKGVQFLETQKLAKYLLRILNFRKRMIHAYGREC